jgi:hypothetical protein
MPLLVIALLFSGALALVAVQADRRFASARSLPMQWGFDGQVNWSAPRRIALAFIPALAAIMFAVLIGLDQNVEPSAGQEAMVLPGFVVMGMTMLAVQQFHLWLVSRTLKR